MPNPRRGWMCQFDTCRADATASGWWPMIGQLAHYCDDHLALVVEVNGVEPRPLQLSDRALRQRKEAANG